MIRKTEKPFVIDIKARDLNEPIFTFYLEFIEIKRLYRQGWLRKDIPKSMCESVADHILGVAVLAWLICDEYLPQLNPSKVMRMALIHDLPEALIGDITPHDGISAKEKEDMEIKALDRLFLRFSKKNEYMSIFREYSKGATEEARFVRELDKLEMALQAFVYEKGGGSDLEEFFMHTKEILKNHHLIKIFNQMDVVRKKVSGIF